MRVVMLDAGVSTSVRYVASCSLSLSSSLTMSLLIKIHCRPKRYPDHLLHCVFDGEESAPLSTQIDFAHGNKSALMKTKCTLLLRVNSVTIHLHRQGHANLYVPMETFVSFHWPTVDRNFIDACYHILSQNFINRAMEDKFLGSCFKQGG